MERKGIDRYEAFALPTRTSQKRTIKVRLLARRVIEGTFASTPHEDRKSQERP